jgi:hypothetical protein
MLAGVNRKHEASRTPAPHTTYDIYLMAGFGKAEKSNSRFLRAQRQPDYLLKTNQRNNYIAYFQIFGIQNSK